MSRYENIFDDYSENTWTEHLSSKVNEDPEYVLECLMKLDSRKDELNVMEIYFLEQAFEGLDEVPEQYSDIHSEYIESREDDSIESWG